MKDLSIVIIVTSLLWCAVAHAAESQNTDFKWLQTPDMEWGYDIWSWGIELTTGDIVIFNDVADDWRCPDGRPISDIHWWGSFKGWMEETPPDPGAGMPVPDAADMPLYFILSMHADDPVGPIDQWSKPANLITDVRVYPSQISISYFAVSEPP